MTITVDKAALLAAMEAIPAAVERHLKLAALVTADRIAGEARGRVRRRTGKTAAGIIVEETHKGDGFVVLSTNQRMPGLPQWIEFGTKYMSASPYLFASARLEEAAHDRRSYQAVQDAIAEKGLGD